MTAVEAAQARGWRHTYVNLLTLLFVTGAYHRKLSDAPGDLHAVDNRQGFRWRESDMTFHVLRGLAAVGRIWDLHGVPEHIAGADLDAVPDVA